MNRTTAALLLIATFGCAGWILARPSEAIAADARPPRERRALFALGALVGFTQLLVQLPANPLAAAAGGAQGILVCSIALGPRGQRVGMLVAVLVAAVALVLNLVGAPAFQGAA